VDFDDQKTKALALALNRTAQLGVFDMEVLGRQLQELYEFDFDIGDIGFDVGEFGLIFDKDETQGEVYSQKIEAPIYEPKGEKPALGELVNLEKTTQLKDKIEKSKVPTEIKQFLSHENFTRRHKEKELI
jgi:hypothetical protein